MSEVKRWVRGYGDMELYEHGAWVAYGDYASIAKQLTEVKAERDRLQIQLRAWQSAFGTTQLTHAKAAFEKATKEDQHD